MERIIDEGKTLNYVVGKSRSECNKILNHFIGHYFKTDQKFIVFRIGYCYKYNNLFEDIYDMKIYVSGEHVGYMYDYEKRLKYYETYQDIDNILFICGDYPKNEEYFKTYKMLNIMDSIMRSRDNVKTIVLSENISKIEHHIEEFFGEINAEEKYNTGKHVLLKLN